MLKLATAVSSPGRRYPWLTSLVETGRPSVGSLMALCEENYRTLLRLVPDLGTIGGEMRSTCMRGMDLHLEVIEQARYTSLLRLTYFFPHDDGQVHHVAQADPDAVLRAYHDACQVEVLNLRQTALPLHNHYHSPALDAKWKANLFLSKWLRYCVILGHSFPDSTRYPAREDDLHLAGI